MSRQLLLHTVSQLSLADLLALHQHVIRAISEKNILSTLPTEIAQQILFLLDPKDLASAARVCRDWNALVDDSTIWQHVASTHTANACVAVEDPYNEAKQRVTQHKRWRSFTPKMAPKKLHFHSTRIVALKNVQVLIRNVRDEWIVSTSANGVVELFDLNGTRMSHWQIDVATVGAVSCMDAQWSLEEQCIWIAVGGFSRHVAVLVVRVSSKEDSHHKVTKTCTPYQDAYVLHMNAVTAILVDSDHLIISGSADGVLQTYNFKESQVIATSSIHSNGRINHIQKRQEIMVVSSTDCLLSIWKANQNPSPIQSDSPWILHHTLTLSHPIHSLVLTETHVIACTKTTLTKISHLQDSPTILKQEGSIHDRSLILHFSSAPSSPTFSVYSKSFIIMDNMGIGFWEYNQHKRKFVQLSELEGYMIKGMNLRVSDPRACVVGSSHLVIGNGNGDLFILGF